MRQLEHLGTKDIALRSSLLEARGKAALRTSHELAWWQASASGESCYPQLAGKVKILDSAGGLVLQRYDALREEWVEYLRPARRESVRRPCGPTGGAG